MVLFAYARADLLRRVLACLRVERVPLIYVFADGAKGETDAAAVAEVRKTLRGIDWAEVRLEERARNFGLGQNVLDGVSAVAARQAAWIAWEDDLVAVPGTYAWLSAALRRYAADERVMSVTAWTHPRVQPEGVNGPYLDGRAECWVWGSWARAWRGMTDATAEGKARAAERRGTARGAYGADLPAMARVERRKNIWAVRWVYHHLEHGGLCVRPPWTMVEHVGLGATATHAGGASEWTNAPLRDAPPIPATWPEPVETKGSREKWRRATAGADRRLVAAWQKARVVTRARGNWKGAVRRLLPARAVEAVVRRFFRVRWTGNYANWAEARAASGGYERREILERVATAACAVREGRAAFERDGVTFALPSPDGLLLGALMRAAERAGEAVTVLDFGGSLGSAYGQNRPWLHATGVRRWCVVEQAHFVTVGQKNFEDETLRFYDTIEACCAAETPAVLLLSSVLPYLPEPDAAIAEAQRRNFATVIVARTGVIAGDADRLTVQHVPRAIYRASYPCRFLGRERLLAQFAGAYRLVEETAADEGEAVGVSFRNFVFERRS